MVEVIIAMFIIAVGILALASTALSSIQSTRISRERQEATQLASGILEDMRALDFGRVALDKGLYTGSNTYEGEDVIAYADGAVPHEVTETPLVANTWVTWTSADQDEKRVTTIVSWEDGGQERQVRQSTLVSEARRGLPAPNFQVSPTSQAQNTVLGEVVCFDHTLTNLGEQDSYSWQLLHDDGTGTLIPGKYKTRNVEEDGTSVKREGFDVESGSGKGAGWFAWARIGPTTDTLDPMVDVTSDSRPDSPAPVERRDEAILRVCYTPRDSSGSVRDDADEQPQYTIRVFSAFDETVTRDVEDSLQVVGALYGLNLHHYYESDGSPVQDHGYNLLMDQAAPIGTSEAVDYDGGGTQGLHLPSTQTVQYWYQNSETVARTVTSAEAYVRVSVATDSSFVGTPSGTVSLTARVSHVPEPDSPVLLGSETVTFTPNSNAWTLYEDLVPISSATIEPSEYLRLELECVTEAEEECHVHYDVAGVHEGVLEVTVE